MLRPLPDAFVPSADDLASCRSLLRDGSRTFHAASHLLPRAVAEPACALYAFCRVADDAVDLRASDTAAQHAALATLRERLARAYAGSPHPIAADRALCAVVAQHRIPRALPEALLEGFEWDAQGRRYEDLADLEAYAARVAGTVGAMMALVMGVRAPDAVARACDLGVAMQLSNIARDVGEDARAGRLYLPLAWLRRAGIDPDAWLAAPVFDAAIAGVVRRLLQCADAHYARAHAGIAQLPVACRPGIYAARYLYAAIGDEVARRGHDSVSQRAVVPTGRKVALVGRAMASIAAPGLRDASAPLPASRFLVDAVVAADAMMPTPEADPSGRIVFVLALFERLERRELEPGYPSAD
jgi:phytoene synthase